MLFKNKSYKKNKNCKTKIEFYIMMFKFFCFFMELNKYQFL